jgi:WD40 repeat protein
MVANSLLDDDVFISYARKDGSLYAMGLADALTKEGFSCFLDKLGTDAGPKPSSELLRKAARCRMLILVGTDVATRSQPVLEEVEAFAIANGTSNIVPITFGSGVNWSEALWYRRVQGVDCAQESPEALRTGAPNELVVTWIKKRFTYTKSKDRLRKYRNGALVTLLLLLMASGLAGWYAQVMIAKAGLAEERVSRAKEQIQEARSQQEAAEAGRTRAEAEERAARERARTAGDEARRQQAIANARELANRANLLLAQGPDSLLEAVALAVESLERANEGNIPILESDTALRRSLSLLPPLRERRIFPGPIHDLALSPNGELVVLLEPDGRSRVLRSDGGEAGANAVAVVCRGAERIAISNGASRLACASSNEIQIFDADTRKEWRIGSAEIGLEEEKAEEIREITLEPDGRYLAAIVSVPGGETQYPVGRVVLWDLDVRERVASLGQDLKAVINDVAFGSEGNLLAAGGVGTGPRDTGYAVFWDLSPLREEGNERLEDSGVIERSRVVESVDGSVLAIAPDKDVHQFAVAQEGSVTVFRQEPRGRFEPAVYLPLPLPVVQLVLRRGGTALSVIEEEGRPLEYYPLNDELDQRNRSHSLWDLAADPMVLRIPYDDMVSDLASGAGGRLAVVSGQGVRVLKGSDASSLGTVGFQLPVSGYSVLAGGRYVLDRERTRLSLWNTFEEKRYELPADVDVWGGDVSRDGHVMVLREKEGDEFRACIYRLSHGTYARTRCISKISGQIALSADGSHAVLVQEAGLRVLNPRTGRNRSTTSLARLDTAYGVRISPKGRYLAAVGRQGIAVARTDTGAIVATLKAGAEVHDVQFSGDEAWLAVARENREAEILEIASGRVVRIRHSQPVSKVVFSPDSQVLATVSHLEKRDETGSWFGDGSMVRLFDPRTGIESSRLQPHQFVTALEFSTDGKYLFTGGVVLTDLSERYELSAWIVRAGDLAGIARQRMQALQAWRASAARRARG